jgi:hypothetical protein
MPPAIFLTLFFHLAIFSNNSFADQTAAQLETQAETRKSYLEDMFIWKMSDELKLTAKEEKLFTETLKKLNKEKSELNKKILVRTDSLHEKSTSEDLRQLNKLLVDYNRYGLREFEAVQNLLGNQKFIQYLKIKNELSLKMKSILIGERSGEKKEDKSSKSLPKPKVTVQKPD